MRPGVSPNGTLGVTNCGRAGHGPGVARMTVVDIVGRVDALAAGPRLGDCRRGGGIRSISGSGLN